jgi:hypothetical protein
MVTAPVPLACCPHSVFQQPLSREMHLLALSILSFATLSIHNLIPMGRAMGYEAAFNENY